MSQKVSAALARYIAGARWDDLPERVRHEAKRSVLNFVGTALAGCRDVAVERSWAVLREFAGAPTATVIGHGERTDPLTAAFLNAAAGNVHDYDDTHIPTIIHPTAPVAPPLLAFAERQTVSGPDLLLAFALGVEVACRLGNAVSPGHYRRGWHITSSCGVFGAAAAAGKLLGLNADEHLWAQGNASAQVSGVVETLGTMSKSIGVGNAARNGLFAALAAQAGVAGPTEPLEGPRGFAAVMGDGADLAGVTAGLGENWELLANTYKPYPCGVVLNPLIDACLALHDQGVNAAAIQRATVRAHPLLGERTDRPDVSTGRESQVSAQHTVAVVLLRGKAGLPEYTDATVADPKVQALRAKVGVVDDPDLAVGVVSLSLDLRDGTRLESTVETARGSLERPLTDAELENKLIAAADFGGSGVEAGPLIEQLWKLDSLDDVAPMLALMRPAG